MRGYHIIPSPLGVEVRMRGLNKLPPIKGEKRSLDAAKRNPGEKNDFENSIGGLNYLLDNGFFICTIKCTGGAA